MKLWIIVYLAGELSGTIGPPIRDWGMPGADRPALSKRQTKFIAKNPQLGHKRGDLTGEHRFAGERMPGASLPAPLTALRVSDR